MKGKIHNQSLVYQQITNFIEEGILDGTYTAHMQVPSTNEMSQVFCINPATAAKGVNQLVDEGLLYKKRGIGMFVEEDARERLLASRRQMFQEQELQIFVKQAQMLQFEKTEILEMIAESLE